MFFAVLNFLYTLLYRKNVKYILKKKKIIILYTNQLYIEQNNNEIGFKIQYIKYYI